MRAGRAARLVLRCAAAAAGTQVGLRLGASTSRYLGPLAFRVDLALARRGGTVIDLAPLGTAHLRTHRGPLRITVRPTAIDPARARGLLRMPEDGADLTAVRNQLDATLATGERAARDLGLALAARSTVAGIGGAAAAAALAMHRPRDVAGAAALSTIGLLAAAASAAATRNPDASRTPELDGLLARAPLILGDLKDAPDRIGTYRDQLADLLRTGTGVYRRVVELPERPPPDAIRLVHISDIHLSPLGLPLAKALVEEYDADAVIDTGDLVDWGTPAENAFAHQIPSLGVPYVYVKGNHDSQGIAAAVARQPNAIVLDTDDPPRQIAGLTFAGMPDPRFTPDKTTGDDHAHHSVGEAAKVFAEKLRAHNTPVDVALVHSPNAAKSLEGLASLVLAGDIHKRVARRFGDTTLLVQGTSGGSGLRGVQQEPPTPVSLSVLYLDRSTRRLWGADEVTLGGLGTTELTVVRRSAADLVGETSGPQ